MKFAVIAVSLSLLAAPAVAQSSGDWRVVAPENLLVIDTPKGRILAELEPRAAPRSVERIRTLADQGFYDGLKFHRVIPDFMAQTGDPQGTGEGSSSLPDLAAEFEFRRGRDSGFAPFATANGRVVGVMGSLPVQTQPDAQMMVTADFKAGAEGVFCSGVLGMARADEPDSANSQFFIMTGSRDRLIGRYSAFGRVLQGMDVVLALKPGQGQSGTVIDPDVMTRVRTAAAMPQADRPTVRVMASASPAYAAAVEAERTRRGSAFGVCDAQPPVEIG